MSVKLHSNKEIVNAVKAGLKRTGGIVLADEIKQTIQNVCVRNLESKSKILNLKDIAIACYIIKAMNKEINNLDKKLHIHILGKKIENQTTVYIILKFCQKCSIILYVTSK